mgnify:CR=1 FL=1
MTLGMQDTLHALADPTRREILNLLKQSRLSAGEISNHFSISGAAISRHLSVLKDADLIRNEREGKFIYYELNATVLEEILLWISELKEGMIMIRQIKITFTYIRYNTASSLYWSVFVESITRFCCNTFWTKQSAGRIFIQSLCSIWPASDSAGSSFSMCGRNKH